MLSNTINYITNIMDNLFTYVRIKLALLEFTIRLSGHDGFGGKHIKSTLIDSFAHLDTQRDCWLICCFVVVLSWRISTLYQISFVLLLKKSFLIILNEYFLSLVERQRGRVRERERERCTRICSGQSY